MPERVRSWAPALAALLLLGGAALASRAWDRGPPPAPPAPPAAPAPEPEAAAPGPEPTALRLRRGDTLVGVLVRAGLDPRAAHAVAAALGRAGADLRRLKPGATVEITWAPSGEPSAVSWQESPWRGYAAVAGEEGWTVRVLETVPDVRVAAVRGQVGRSLFEAVEAAGEQAALVPALVALFESEFDFTADSRPGDRFRVLVEKRYAGERFVSYGRILAAQYASGRRLLTAIGHTTRGRFGHYDLEGHSLRRTFLRSPLEFTRLTSGYTLARRHPILGGVLPHLAVDYAAPVGTPVRAVADGLVSGAGWDGGYGIAVRLRHRAGYETLYAHLSGLGPGIRPGARVRQRQVIGYVGSTGRSTGPHLHYEVVKDGRRVNPLAEKFLPGEPIPPSERAEFRRHARALLERLEADAPF